MRLRKRTTFDPGLPAVLIEPLTARRPPARFTVRTTRAGALSVKRRLLPFSAKPLTASLVTDGAPAPAAGAEPGCCCEPAAEAAGAAAAPGFCDRSTSAGPQSGCAPPGTTRLSESDPHDRSPTETTCTPSASE